MSSSSFLGSERLNAVIKHCNWHTLKAFCNIFNFYIINLEISDIPEITEPVTVSNKSGYGTRSGRMSKPPVKLNL